MKKVILMAILVFSAGIAQSQSVLSEIYNSSGNNSTQSCSSTCQFQYNRCLDNGLPFGYCNNTLNACLNSCNNGGTGGGGTGGGGTGAPRPRCDIPNTPGHYCWEW